MAIPSGKELIYPILDVISKNPRIGTQELYKKMQEVFHPSEEDLTILTKSGESQFNNRIRWVILNLKKMGLIESVERGQYRITELAENNVSPDNPLTNHSTGLNLIQESDSEDSEQVILSSDEHYESIEQEILKRLTNLGEHSVDKGSRFEILCLKLLEALGYGTAE